MSCDILSHSTVIFAVKTNSFVSWLTLHHVTQNSFLGFWTWRSDAYEWLKRLIFSGLASFTVHSDEI